MASVLRAFLSKICVICGLVLYPSAVSLSGRYETIILTAGKPQDIYLRRKVRVTTVFKIWR